MAGRPHQFSHRLILRRHRSMLAGPSHLLVEGEAKGEQHSVQPPNVIPTLGVRHILTLTPHLLRHLGLTEPATRFGMARAIANVGNSGSMTTILNLSAQHQRNQNTNVINPATDVHNSKCNNSNFRRNSNNGVASSSHLHSSHLTNIRRNSNLFNSSNFNKTTYVPTYSTTTIPLSLSYEFPHCHNN